MSLNENQKKFCEYYLEFGDITKAEEKAGYSKGRGNALIKLLHIQKYITERLDKKSLDYIANEPEILKYLTKVMRGEDDEKTGIKEKLKAAELLGKAYSIFSAKNEEKKINPVIISGEDEIFE
ncbi:MAG: terminase small subunit [Eubacteriales bacterium]|nr:terminase small subunit [Eubacteriales bacterium]